MSKQLKSNNSVWENFEGIAGPRSGKTFKIAGPANLSQVFIIVTYENCFYKILPAGHANISYSALAITPSHQQNTHDFADGRKNMNDIFNNYVCSASHMRSGLHFQNV